MRHCVSSSKNELFKSTYHMSIKRKRNFSFNSSNSEIIQYKPKDKNFFLTKKDILISVLNIIKISQIRFLSAKSKDKKILSKQILNNLIKELTDYLREKENIKKELEDDIKIRKDFLYKEIFGKNISNKFDDKKIGKNKQMNKLHNMNAELKYLKTLNFIIENQINSLNDDFMLKIFTYNYLKNVKFMKEINREKKCEHKNDILEAGNLLHQQLLNNRKKFINLVSRKNFQNEEIISTSNKIESIEKSIYFSGKKGSKKYIESNEVIPELSNDYSKQYNFSTIETKNKNNMLLINNIEYQNQINNIISINNINNIININIINDEYKYDNEKIFENKGNLKLRKGISLQNAINNVNIKNLNKYKMN